MVTSVLTTAVARAADLAGGLLGITTIIALIVSVVVKELGSAQVRRGRRHNRLRFLVSALDAPILSLLAVFILIVVVRAWEVL